MNPSKQSDERFWNRWNASGAVGDSSTLNTAVNREFSLRHSKRLVLPSLRKGWCDYLKTNQSPTASCILNTSVAMMDALSQDLSVEDALAHGSYGMTGGMMAYAVSVVAEFHPRGEEFRTYWNGRFSHSDPETIKGVVNPSIIEYTR